MHYWRKNCHVVSHKSLSSLCCLWFPPTYGIQPKLLNMVFSALWEHWPPVLNSSTQVVMVSCSHLSPFYISRHLLDPVLPFAVSWLMPIPQGFSSAPSLENTLTSHWWPPLGLISILDLWPPHLQAVWFPHNTGSEVALEQTMKHSFNIWFLSVTDFISMQHYSMHVFVHWLLLETAKSRS